MTRVVVEVDVHLDDVLDNVDVNDVLQYYTNEQILSFCNESDIGLSFDQWKFLDELLLTLDQSLEVTDLRETVMNVRKYCD